MLLFNAILVGFREIWAHKFRSLLTMLGIILGVSSLVAMAALVKGMENGMKEALIALGGLDKVELDDKDVPAYQQDVADQAPGRTMKDVYALRRSAPLIRLVSPEMALDRPTIARGDKRVRPSGLLGVWPAALEMNQHEIEYGRFFTALDEENANAVCVIGTGVRDELFGNPEQTGREIVPVGRVVQINGQAFTIVGMFKHYESDQDRKTREQAKEQPPEKKKGGPARGRSFGGGRSRNNWVFWRKNMTVYIPLNSMWVRFRSSAGTNNVPDPKLSDINIKVANLDQMNPALQQARNVMMLAHNGIEDFGFQTQENSVDNIDKAIRSARMSGGIISGISLLVGGIGIMNIMLASITERVREIGIRKAIGATTGAIFVQILVESMVIAMIGALAGMACSYSLVQFLIYLSPTDNTPVITTEAMFFALICSAAIGMLAGLFPAFKAARLDPIEALRYE